MSKIEAFWQDATADDVAEIMKTGKPIPARTRNANNEVWREDLISGWSLPKFLPVAVWIDLDGVRWKQCQVYREPSWYAKKPDPGLGWRLLEKLEPEALQCGDEWFDPNVEAWRPSENASRGEPQNTQVWYRRRIEPVEPKFAVGQMVRVVGPKVKPAKDWGKEMDRQIGFVGVIRSIPILEGEGTFYNLEGIGIWCFREDYLEAVEPVEHYLGKVEAIKQFIVGDTFRHPSGLRLTITAKGFEVTQ